ncbi:MAG: hypothetical protein J0I41_11975 [Filimonas sp.]|nr:hypothetical protein [Filimonas sp.]
MRKILLVLSCLSANYLIAQNTYPYPSNGPLGLGTTTPLGVLHVKGSRTYDGFNQFYLTNNATDYGRTNFIITGRLQDRNDSWIFGSGARNSIVFAQNEATQSGENPGEVGTERFSIQLEGVSRSLGFLSSANGNTPNLSITQNGEVGIGTGYPRAILDMAMQRENALSTVLARLPEGNSTGSGTYLGVRNFSTNVVDANSFSLEHRFYGLLNSAINFTRGGGQTGGFITFATNDGTEKARLDADGNFRVGTISNFGMKLAVDGGAYFNTKGTEAVYIGNPNGGTGGYTSLSLSVSGEKNGYSILQSIESAGSTYGKLNINPYGGNVGIGTFNPTEKLSVDGNIRSRKVIVTQTGWSDYVFDPSYKLPSLDSVAAFVQENKHLPEVPSAATVIKEGLDVGEMQKLLLQKIEELTLYVIDLKKENSEMKKENAALKQRVEKIETK